MPEKEGMGTVGRLAEKTILIMGKPLKKTQEIVHKGQKEDRTKKRGRTSGIYSGGELQVERFPSMESRVWGGGGWGKTMAFGRDLGDASRWG